MMNSVFALALGSNGFSERASTAGIVALQGMLTIFLVLGVLWGAIEILHRIANREPKEEPKAQAPQAQTTPTAPMDDKAVAAAIAAAMAASEDEGAVVAAITAAVSAALAEDGYTGSFRVVSFKRVSAVRHQR